MLKHHPKRRDFTIKSNSTFFPKGEQTLDNMVGIARPSVQVCITRVTSRTETRRRIKAVLFIDERAKPSINGRQQFYIMDSRLQLTDYLIFGGIGVSSILSINRALSRFE